MPKLAKNALPFIKFDPVSPALIHPSEILGYYQKAQNLEKFTAEKICIGCFDPLVLEEMVKKTGAQEDPGWLFNDYPEMKLYTFPGKIKPASVVRLGYGAASAVTTMELLIACGVEKFIFLGSAGALQPLPFGSLVIASRAIREEGVSYHYLQPEPTVEGSTGILLALERACKKLNLTYDIGSTWTTDAVFRETKSKVKKYKAEGILTVEMEAAALYAVAAFRNVEAGGIFYISDSLTDLTWHPGFFAEEVRQGLLRSCEVVLATLDEGFLG